jgi:inner membrane protein
MDPLSQGVLGAAAAQAVVGERLGRKSWWLGALAGMAPDLDVLIRSPSDPLVALEYHRHFTHSLAFIPVGGLLVALPFVLAARERPREHKQLILAATTLGWATHGLLDAFTSYGTLLWWPFSRARVAFDWISIIDPIYTLTLALGVVLAARRVSARPARLALLLSTLYLGACGVQHARASHAQARLARERGDEIVRAKVQPLLLTNLLWRSVYETPAGQLHADAFAAPWWGRSRHHGGATRAKLEAPSRPESARGRDLALFVWFTIDWAYADSGQDKETELVCDARYSFEPGGFAPIFCLELGREGAVAVHQRQPNEPTAMLGGMFELLR